jgi:signal transduction histidine kinase
MQIQGSRAALWAGRVATAAGFVLTLLLLLLVNVFGYQKMRQFMESCSEPAQAGELLRILIVTDLFALVFLSVLVFLLNRQLTRREETDRTTRKTRAEQENQWRQRVDELMRLNQTLQVEHHERQRAANQLVHLQKMESLGKLVSTVGHEFNNYLTVILGFSEQLGMQLTPGTVEHAIVMEIYKAGERSAELTRGVLGLARSSDGTPRPIDINRQVDSMRRILNLLLGKRVRLEIVLQGELPLVQAVPGQVEQVLLNLATNSRDAMPSGGRLLIETMTTEVNVPSRLPPGSYVVLSVTDTGCGLNDEIRQRMFEPYYTTKEKGTGLGLPTVQEIATRGGGAVVADSMLGQGTTFKVYWPALPEHATLMSDAERETVVNMARGKHDTVHD